MLIRRAFTILIIIIISHTSIIAGIKGINRDRYRIHITESKTELNVDGKLDEAAWQNAEVANGFIRVLPVDTGYAAAQTEVKVVYSPTTLYVGIICHDAIRGKRPVESLRRDFNFQKNDNFVLFLDTFNDQTNGFAFGVSAAGAQWDGVESNGSSVNLDWEIKWKSEVQNYDDYWIAEFGIPFRSIRYIGGEKEWGINFSRLDLKTNEKSSWAPMPRQFTTSNLAYTGSLVWNKPLPSSGARFSFIPYLSARATKDLEAGDGIKPSVNGGLDAKVILTTSMNLDLTINPDYSQVEVDRQRTNLDRFELFFPEKRQFYLENSDLFANLGSETIRPFFSRRIGLSSPVQAGARLSGRIGNNWRVGLMDIQTGVKDDIRAGNFTVAAVQRNLFSRSNISVFVVNKQVLNVAADTAFTGNRYNRVAGIEYNLASRDNRWTGKAFYHKSFSPQSSSGGSAAAANLIYSTQYITASLGQSWVGTDFIAETGYIRRRGYYEITPSFLYKFYPSKGAIVNHGPVIKVDMFTDHSMNLTDRESQFMYQIETKRKNLFQLDFRETFMKLDKPFDPTNTGGIPLEQGSSYNWHEFGLAFTSDIRKPLNTLLTARYGSYFNGTRVALGGELYYRVQPYGSVAIISSYNKIDLPTPWSSANFILIGPRVDLTFTSKLFLTGIAQYNNQIDNLNLNIRFQWRFAPVSDIYIVYTENSIPGSYTIKNRGLVFKISYWFN